MEALTPMAASSLLFEAAAKRPDQIRFIAPDPVSLGELAHRVRAVASWLVGRGVKPGDHVGIWADNCLEWAVSAWAVQAAGAAFVTIHATITGAFATIDATIHATIQAFLSACLV